MLSGCTSSPRVLCILGISLTKGTTFPKNSIRRRTHISFSADMQKMGNSERATKPLRIPKRISSSVKVSVSKNFSISVSSFSAAASTNFLCSSKAFGISLSGIFSIEGTPPSGFHLYIFISKTSTTALKFVPVSRGY